MRPAYITQTRSASPAITDRSCVIQISAVPVSRVSFCISNRICPWIVTSSAVVGSSAMMRSGLLSSAMAMATRWRMPPENWCGYACSRSSGDGMPTLTSAARARSSAAARETFSCARIVSIICASMRRTGFSVIIGSWKIIAMRLPRSWRISSGGQRAQVAAVRARSLPATMRPGGSMRPMIE